MRIQPFFIISFLLPESKLPWSHSWANLMQVSYWGALCPSCPLEAGLHTSGNTDSITKLSEGFPSHQQWDSFSISDSIPEPGSCLLSVLILYQFYSHWFPLRSPCFPCCFWNIAYILLSQNLLLIFAYSLPHFIYITIETVLLREAYSQKLLLEREGIK